MSTRSAAIATHCRKPACGFLAGVHVYLGPHPRRALAQEQDGIKTGEPSGCHVIRLWRCVGPHHLASTRAPRRPQPLHMATYDIDEWAGGANRQCPGPRTLLEDPNPLSWIVAMRTTSANDTFDPALWTTVSTTLGVEVPVLSSLAAIIVCLLSVVAKNMLWTFVATTQPPVPLTQVQPRHMIGW